MTTTDEGQTAYTAALLPGPGRLRRRAQHPDAVSRPCHQPPATP
ncbi:hypothetical protein SSBG_00560 [Streptomyces sp. SPB074]|nr:hypothetical protein SSBG_00560 [Streptomyces sp. SPB074]